MAASAIRALVSAGNRRRFAVISLEPFSAPNPPYNLNLNHCPEIRDHYTIHALATRRVAAFVHDKGFRASPKRIRRADGGGKEGFSVTQKVSTQAPAWGLPQETSSATMARIHSQKTNVDGLR
jgi:hypothetical protein